MRGDQFELLRRKGVYPYAYMDSLRKLEEKQLPPIDRLYSHLTDEGISEEDYEHAKTVWKEFEIGSMRNYHDLYLLSDVLLLADVFENFRNVCLKNYKLDAAWYYTGSWCSLGRSVKNDGSRIRTSHRS